MGVAEEFDAAVDKLHAALGELAKSPPDKQRARANLEAAVAGLETTMKHFVPDAAKRAALIAKLRATARELADDVPNEQYRSRQTSG